jgi:hypothetical protein
VNTECKPHLRERGANKHVQFSVIAALDDCVGVPRQGVRRASDPFVFRQVDTHPSLECPEQMSPTRYREVF